MSTTTTTVVKPPAPPFTAATALAKVKAAQNLWNTRDPARVAEAYTADTVWRNRDKFIKGKEQVTEFLQKKWEKEHHYILRKELFAFTDNKIAVQFFYEWNEQADGQGQWFRTYGLEDWTFAPSGLMYKRQMSGNDVAIESAERWFTGGLDSVEGFEIDEKHL